jgi:hypothetical protein
MRSMVDHIVLFKLKDSASAEQKAAMLKALLALKDQIPGIVQASAGANFSDRARGYTHGFTVRFRDRAALDAYLPHPAHQAVVESHVKPINDAVLVVDYEPL